jgi:hypothetical protein
VIKVKKKTAIVVGILILGLLAASAPTATALERNYRCIRSIPTGGMGDAATINVGALTAKILSQHGWKCELIPPAPTPG